MAVIRFVSARDCGRQLETDVVAQNALGGLTFAKGGALSALDNFLDNFLGHIRLRREDLWPNAHRSSLMEERVLCSG